MINLGLIECTYPAIVTGYQTSSFLNKPVISILQNKMKNQCETRRYIKEVLFRFACAFGDMDFIQRIGAENEFDVMSCDHLNRTAMHYAVMTKRILHSLINSTSYSKSAEECMKGHPGVFDYLINQNTDLLDSKNISGNTPRFLLQRDITNEDKDTQEQAKIMLSQLEQHDLSTNLQTFSM